MNSEEMERKLNIQKEHYTDVPKEYVRGDKRANSNHYYKIEQIEKGFYDHLISKGFKEKYKFMEIGAGTGIHAEHFLDVYSGRADRFIACDLSEAMLEVSKQRLAKYAYITEFCRSAAEEIDIDIKMDGIYISGAMHHFADPCRAVLKIRDILDENGVLIICEPNVWNPYNFFRALRELKEESGQFNAAARNMIRGYLQNAGFFVVEEKVLHYRSGQKWLRDLWPYEKFGKYRWMDLLSVMFMFVARRKTR